MQPDCRRRGAAVSRGTGGEQPLGSAPDAAPCPPHQPPHQPQDFYGAAEEVALPFDQEEGVSDLSTWSKKM